MTPDLLSAIVLLGPQQSPHELDLALLALAVQEFENLQTVIVCNETQKADVRKICEIQPWTKTMHCEIVAFPSGLKDNYSNRLNTALNAASGQYISILQTNDIVYGFAFKKLIDLLKKSTEAIAVCRTRRAYDNADGYMSTKSNQVRAAKHKFDIWFDEYWLRNFVIDRSRVRGNLATEPALDYYETDFLLLTLSLHNEFNFSYAGESMFERRICSGHAEISDEELELKYRARSKVIDWKSAQLNNFLQQRNA